MTITVRHVDPRLTNFPYRLVEESDLVAGLEVFYVEPEHYIDPSLDPKVWAWWIKLDPDPVRDTSLGVYVFYHFTLPESWSKQDCFVPLESFTEQFERQPLDGNCHFWLPIKPE